MKMLCAPLLMVAVWAASPDRPSKLSSDTCAAAPAMNAESLLAAGRFWHAWRALPALRARTRPMPADSVVLYGAAAEGLGQFGQVDQLLARSRGGERSPAFLLLAARADERGERWRSAESRYRRVLALRDSGEESRSAAVRLAMVLERTGTRDSAVQAWRRAAIAVPELADWFALRRAALEPDTAIAFATVSGPRTPGARSSSQLLVAQRKLQAGDLTGALDLFRRYGKPLDVAHVLFAMGQKDQARALADTTLFRDPPTILNANGFLAATFLTQHYRDLSFAENLAVSRTYRVHGDRFAAQRFVRNALARLGGRRPDTLAVQGWLELARLSAERKNLRDALRAIDSAVSRSTPGSAGAIGAARVQAYAAADRWGEAETEMLSLAATRPGDTSVARAVLSIADHDRGRGDTGPERSRYVMLLRYFPDAPAAVTARFRLGLVAYLEGHRDSALTLVREAARRDSLRGLGLGPRYWESRLRLERGDSTAKLELRRLAADFPLSFYGVRAREVLGDTAFLADTLIAPPGQGAFPPARARERVQQLAAFGLDAEARAEATGWALDTTTSVYVLLAAADAAAEAGYARESIALGDIARQRVGITPGVARALFPLPYREVIESEAGEHCIDPLLLAALIRQESRFDPRAVSRVGARGIGQVMPATGRQLAERLRLGPWNRDFLFVPDFNLHLGVTFVYQQEQRDSFPVYALLAAYNAGPGRVSKWKSWPEYPDPDLFAERVSILETRDYVRTVYASYVWYQYAWKTAPSAAPPDRPASIVP